MGLPWGGQSSELMNAGNHRYVVKDMSRTAKSRVYLEVRGSKILACLELQGCPEA